MADNLRATLSDALKDAMRARDQRATGTLRLILAALKDRDIAARGRGNSEGIDPAEIVEMLRRMVRQRQESIELYEKGDRPELAQQEREEIVIIERYLPKLFDETQTRAAVDEAVTAVGAQSVKEMGKVMAYLKDKYASQIDMAKAGAAVKQRFG
jgi:uncharacterized protein